MCRLKPIDYNKYCYKNLPLKPILKWVDEYNNELDIEKNKKPKISFGSLSDKHSNFSTDLYYGVSISSIHKISNSIILASSLDEDTLQPTSAISFMGIDGFLRTFLLNYGSWSSVSSLSWDLKILKVFSVSRHMQNIKGKNLLMPSRPNNIWISPLPLDESFLTYLSSTHKHVVNLF
jgi:hypothetical protein